MKYLACYFGLLLLLAATVLVAHVPLGPFNLIVALLLATLKALLVLWFFMHLRSESSLVYLFFGTGLMMLVLASVLTFADYLTRA